jgi:adenylate cyclase
MSDSSGTPSASPTRELAAIMFSDIAGYTAIMGRDERKALRALDDHRELLRTILPRFNGRLVGEIGDGTLSSFHSALDAVNCARAAQAALQDDPSLKLRIGIHLGDVVFSNNTVLGDGVNVASRIHALASPGTVVLVRHLSLRPPTPSASIPAAQSPALSLPDKPSIAVLSFTNMSGDREQEYFSDGITDDLITSLSRVPNLFVIARTSTFTYKGKAAKVQDISRDLGVQYVLEGSVRKAADTVRITAQLVDATNGDHLWAAHYDRPLRDIFSLQDELVRKIVTTLKLRLSVEQYGEVVGQHTDNLEAYDYYLRCWEYPWGMTEEENAKAARMCEKALELDPGYADAYAELANRYGYAFAVQFKQYGGPNALDRAIELYQRAISLDDANASAHAMLGRALVYKWQYDKALAESERAIALAPGSASVNFWVGATLSRSGKPAEGLAYIEKAERLDPHSQTFDELEEGVAYVLMGRYQEAVPLLLAHLATYPNAMGGHWYLIVAYSELNRPEQARAEALELLRIIPHFSVDTWKESAPFRDRAFTKRADADLRKAGLK